MRGWPSVRVALVLLIVGASCLASASATVGETGSATDTGYEITISDHLDTPKRTVTVEESDYTVSAVAVRQPGEPISVSVSAPTDEGYDLYLYNAEREIEVLNRMQGSDQTTIETDELSVGSYVLAVYKRGEFMTVYPVVISGYDVSLAVPNTVKNSAALTVEATVTNRSANREYDTLEVTLVDQNTTRRVTARQISDEQYSATISLSDIASGTYRVYAAAQDKQTSGRDEFVGVSDSHQVVVENSGSKVTSTSEQSTDQTTRSTTNTMPSGSSSDTASEESANEVTDSPTTQRDSDVLTPNMSNSGTGSEEPATPKNGTGTTGPNRAVVILLVALTIIGTLTRLHDLRH